MASSAERADEGLPCGSALELTRSLFPDWSPSYTLVYVALLNGAGKTDDVAERAGVSRASAYQALNEAESQGHAVSEKVGSARRGRDPTVWEATPPEEPPVTTDPTERDVLEALVAIHYQRGLSSATTSQIAERLGCNPSSLSSLMGHMSGGKVEVLNPDRTSANRYRLTPTDEYAPYRA